MTKADVEALAAARERWARSARGPLALVNAQRVDHAQPVWPVPGEWAPAVGGLTVTATPEDGVEVDGVPVDGTVLVAGDDAEVPSVVAFPEGYAGTVGAVQHGHVLRVWDPRAESIARFARIARFPWSDDLVGRGHFTPAGTDEASTVTDAAGEPLPVAGRITTTIGGVPVSLVAVRSGEHDGVPRLQLIVQDATSGRPEGDPDSTYSMGRFLFLDDPGAEADVELDWNGLVLPPCAFSYQYACPIPPADNRIAAAVEAGERHPVDVDGAVLH